MSSIEKIGTQVGNTCVGAFAVMLGDPSGGTLAATGVVGFAAIGAAIMSANAKRVCKAAHRKAVDAMEASPEFRNVSKDRVLVLLEGAQIDASKVDLIRATQQAKDLDVSGALAKLVYDALPFDQDDEATKRVLLLALEAGMRACHNDAAFQDGLKSVHLTHLVQAVAGMDEKLTRLLAQSGNKARELHLTEKLFITLAKRIATDVEDITQAHNELERAVEIATRKPTTGNLDADVNAVLEEVRRLNADDRMVEAKQALREALERKRAQQEQVAAEVSALIRSGIDQAVLMRDVEEAARLVAEQVEAETPDVTRRFEALRAAQDDWYVRGRDQGLAFDLEVSIAVAKICLAHATDTDEHGLAFNDAGIALWTLGERESGTARLEEAVAAYRAALEEYTRERVPLDWAMTQNNLGNALLALGERESGTARLEEAVAAFRKALEEWTRARVPLDWAMTQNNLGNALSTLGARESGTARLEAAVSAYRAALEERTRERVPLDWAMTQNNLGTALRILGDRESGTARLEEAVAAFRAALEERTRERVPLNWATTQNNLGVALQNLGARENGTAQLEEAVVAFRAALEERTRERVPFQWAATTENLGLVYEALFDKTGERARLEEAIALVRAAREVYDAAGASFYIEKSDRILANMEAKL
jgi:tetratricopeptide (TPR) repeat protein